MSDIYVTAAFRTNIENQAYVFMKNEFVKLHYTPDSTGDKIQYGPAKTSEFPSLKDTIFADGIDCAFGSESDNPGEAYIFAWNNCAKWSYPSDTRDDKIIKGPVPIATMFPFLKGTVFENGVDAAFESSVPCEAYLFKGDQYAHINYGAQDPKLINWGPLNDNWNCFYDTAFKNGCFDAAFASHIKNEAYIFRGDSYLRIKFTPGQVSDKHIGDVKKIKGNWNQLGDILPRKQSQLN